LISFCQESQLLTWFFKSHQITINMWPWHEFQNTLINNNSQHLSMSFLFNTCFVKKSSLGKNLYYSIFFLSSILTKKAFQETYSWWLFSRGGLLGCKHWTQGTNVPWVYCKKQDLLLGWSLDTKDKCLLGSLQEVGITSWLLSLDTRDQRSLGFIARSGNNFLVVITEHKGGKSFVVHCL